MNPASELVGLDLLDFAPMVERAVDIDAESMVRFRTATRDQVSAFVRLPFDVLAARTVLVESRAELRFDVTVSGPDFLRWTTDPAAVPARKDAHWLSPLPPRQGWRRVDRVPDSAVRTVVRSGALAAADATTRRGQQSLLSSVALTVTDDQAGPIEVPLAPLSALTRMGFLPRNSEALIDLAPGWTRVVARFGSTYIGSGSGPLLIGL